MSYNNLDRAARDPYYRIAYEDQQRQQKQARDIAQMRASASASVSTSTSSSSFSMPSSPVSSYSGSYSSSGNSGEAERFFMWLFRFMAPPALFLLFTIGFLQFYASSGASSLGRLGLWVLFFAAAIGFAIRYWRQVAVIAAGAALYYGAHLT